MGLEGCLDEEGGGLGCPKAETRFKAEAIEDFELDVREDGDGAEGCRRVDEVVSVR